MESIDISIINHSENVTLMCVSPTVYIPGWTWLIMTLMASEM